MLMIYNSFRRIITITNNYYCLKPLFEAVIFINIILDTKAEILRQIIWKSASDLEIK